jgi:hypothetical protein
MIEDVCLDSVAADPAMPCVDGYLACLAAAGFTVRHRAKARLHAFLASRTEPDTDIGTAARWGYWPFGSPAFGPLVDLLRAM